MKTIFVSSTFKDLQLERDAIRDITMPLVNQTARSYGESVYFCDLRWGINTEDCNDDTSELKILNACLDEIDRSSPPLVVILGDRYGWIPDEDRVMTVAKRKKMQLDDWRKSVTALEIEYGAFMSQAKLDNTLFYIREVVGDSIIDDTEDNDHVRKLEQLKNRVYELTKGKWKKYRINVTSKKISGINAFGKMLAEDVISFLKPKWEYISKLCFYDYQQYLHTNYAIENSNNFCVMGSVLQDCREGLLTHFRVAAKGDYGRGKTTLLSALYTTLENTNYNVMPFFCGFNSHSCTTISALKQVVYFVEELMSKEHLVNAPDFIEEDYGLWDWWHHLKDLLAMCRGKPDVYFLFDSIDRLDQPDILIDIFSSKYVPENIKLFFTCNDSFYVKDICTIPLPLLSDDEKRQVVVHNVDLTGRTLSNKLFSEIIQLEQSSNPAYLIFLIRRLTMMNYIDFQQINQYGGGVDAITDRQRAIIQNAPLSTEALLLEIIQEFANRINSNLIHRVISYIAISKRGLNRTALRELLKEQWVEVDFACFVSCMSDMLILREDGRYDISNLMIKKRIRQDSVDAFSLHKNIFQYIFESKEITPNDDDLDYHAIYISSMETLCRSITQIKSNLREYSEKTPYLNRLREIAEDMSNTASFDCVQFIEYASSNDFDSVMQFVVEFLANALAKTQDQGSMYNLVKISKKYFGRENRRSNCLFYLRTLLMAVSLASQLNDYVLLSSLLNEIPQIVDDAKKVSFTVLKKKEPSEKDRLAKQNHTENKMFIAGIGGVGDSHHTELMIMYCKSELIKLAQEIMKVNVAGKVFETVSEIFAKSNLVHFCYCATYRGWLLSEGVEDMCALRTRRITANNGSTLLRMLAKTPSDGKQ